jgi:hypothetical protein
MRKDLLQKRERKQLQQKQQKEQKNKDPHSLRK